MSTPESPLEAAIAEFRQILDAVPDKLSRISDADANGSSGIGQWSRKQILGHLIDSASNNHQRFVRGQLQEDLSSPGYAQEAWVSTQHYQERQWADLVAFWAAYNKHLLHLMASVPEDRRRHLCRIGGADPVTLEFVMEDYVRHLKHHMQQVLGQDFITRSQSG
jgi:hypothetical protein